MNPAIDDDDLRGYLAEDLPATEMARIEKSLRDSADLRERLERVRLDRVDAGLHTLGAIWRRSRVTCLSRETLGSYLLDVLDRSQAGYIRFHLEVIECAFCQANFADLKRRSQTEPDGRPVDRERGRRIFDSSRELLAGDS